MSKLDGRGGNGAGRGDDGREDRKKEPRKRRKAASPPDPKVARMLERIFGPRNATRDKDPDR